jgi:hypothetical protein
MSLNLKIHFQLQIQMNARLLATSTARALFTKLATNYFRVGCLIETIEIGLEHAPFVVLIFFSSFEHA